MMQAYDFSIHGLRRKELLQRVKEQSSDAKGLIVFFAGFETGRLAFRQESTFYYLTGITEPGVVLTLDIESGTSELFIPNCDQERAKWMAAAVPLTQENAKTLGLNKISYLGEQCVGYQFHPFFPPQEYTHLLARFHDVINGGQLIYTLYPKDPATYAEPRLLLERLRQFLPQLHAHCVDIAPLIADMRRKKDMSEIERMYKAAEVTMLAQDAASKAIADGVAECEVQAALEYVFIGSQARVAFPSIVAGGKNSTVLHYHENNELLKNGGLVVVDIGAEFEYYCADITRTYPISGTFTKRQREIYNLVLETQEYIAGIAKPGMWLSNKERPEQSLNHLAKKYLEERGYGNYFIHGIGHFLGLDVHDVGDYRKPLEEGDVITIEPGIYIPEEQIGVRIEDDYWIVKDGVVCLSEGLPKTADEIEAMVQQSFTLDVEEETEAFDADEDEHLDD